METGHRSIRAVNSGSGNRALGVRREVEMLQSTLVHQADVRCQSRLRCVLRRPSVQGSRRRLSVGLAQRTNSLDGHGSETYAHSTSDGQLN